MLAQMRKLLETRWSVALILAVSFTVHFLFFGHPNQVVFDEVHFGKFISAYYTHEYYFDIHPPLGKLMIAGFGKLFDFQPEYSFAEIGQAFPDNKYLALRFLPSLAGALLPLILYLLAIEIGISRLGALVLGLLISFENALLVQTRHILLDGFLLLFGFTALLFYFRYYNSSTSLTTGERSWKQLIGTGIFAACAMSIKWTGLTFLALPLLIEFYELIRTRKLPDLLPKTIFLGALPLLLYGAIFAIHFSLLYKSGDGDAFMSQRFQATLEGSIVESHEPPPTLVEKIVELNAEMFRSNQRLTADHPYGSKWYTWPLLVRPIYYWVKGEGRIYLLGNPISWWLSSIAVIVLTFLTIFHTRTIQRVAVILLMGYIMNLLPFVGIHRVMFLYHYLTALIFAYLILVYLIDQESLRNKLFVGTTLLALASFIYFAPLSYGLDLTETAYQARVWLLSWR